MLCSHGKQNLNCENEKGKVKSMAAHSLKYTPGVISEKLREALGINDKQLPPYIYRMRCYGYPPGYHRNRRLDLAPPTTEVSLLKTYGKHGVTDTYTFRTLPSNYTLHSLFPVIFYNSDITIVQYPCLSACSPLARPRPAPV